MLPWADAQAMQMHLNDEINPLRRGSPAQMKWRSSWLGLSLIDRAAFRAHPPGDSDLIRPPVPI